MAAKEIEIQDEKSFRNTLKELDVMSRLTYESIIEVYGYSKTTREDKNYFVMVMEKADGSLEDIIGRPSSDGSLKKDCSFEDKKLYIIQIAHGLWCMNRENLFHGDVKLDNVMIVEGNCKLVDFGLTVSFNQESSEIQSCVMYRIGLVQRNLCGGKSDSVSM